MNESMHPLLINARQAAEWLAISERQLWTLTKSGELRCVRIGRSVRYDPRDLTQWIESKKSAG